MAADRQLLLAPPLPPFPSPSCKLLSHPSCLHAEVSRLQEAVPCSSHRIKLAAVVLVVVSIPPEHLQAAPAASELEEGIVLPDLLQQASPVQVGFCKGHLQGLQLPLQLWHFLQLQGCC